MRFSQLKLQHNSMVYFNYQLRNVLRESNLCSLCIESSPKENMLCISLFSDFDENKIYQDPRQRCKLQVSLEVKGKRNTTVCRNVAMHGHSDFKTILYIYIYVNTISVYI